METVCPPHRRCPQRYLSAGIIVGLCALVLPAAPGCSRLQQKRTKKYHTLGVDEGKEANQAKALNQQAMEAMEAGEWSDAETLLDEALAIDVNYGPAHNNLGQIYLRRHQLYLAAWEFEFARNLMPDRLQPHFNLGLVYETAGQHDQAREHYQTAYNMEPGEPNAAANLARICVKLDEDPAYISQLLNQVVLGDSRPTWVRWAKDLLATRYRPSAWETRPEPSMSSGADAPSSYALPLALPQAEGTPASSGNTNGGGDLLLAEPESVPLPAEVPPSSSSFPPLPERKQGTSELTPLNLGPLPGLKEASPMDVSRRLMEIPDLPRGFAMPFPVQPASATSRAPEQGESRGQEKAPK